MPSDSESIQTSQASECFLLGLAEELLISILLELGPADLLSCTNVCRVIAEVIEQTPAVQYKLQLGLSGMVDGPAGVAPLGKRLERLRAYRAASLQCKADVKVVSMPDCCNLWRLTDCVFAFERRGIVRMVRFASSFTGITEGDIGHLDCTKSITDPGFSICDCVIDRAQDLAILTHVNGNEKPLMFLLSISQGGAFHPLANKPRLEAREALVAGYQAEEVIETCGDLVAWSISDRYSHSAQLEDGTSRLGGGQTAAIH